MPFFHFKDIAALLSHVQVFIFCPFTLNMLFKMPHKSKGSSSCFCVQPWSKSQGISSLRGRFILCEFYCHSCQSRGGEEDTRGSRKKNHTKEVAFSQQHSQLKGRRSSISSACFKNVVFSLLAGPCRNLNRPYESHASLFFFFFFSLRT